MAHTAVCTGGRWIWSKMLPFTIYCTWRTSGTRPNTAGIATHIKLPHVHIICSAAAASSSIYCNLLQSQQQQQQIKCPAQNFPHFHDVRSAGNLLCSFLKSPPSLNFAVKYPAVCNSHTTLIHALDFKILLQLLKVSWFRTPENSSVYSFPIKNAIQVYLTECAISAQNVFLFIGIVIFSRHVPPPCCRPAHYRATKLGAHAALLLHAGFVQYLGLPTHVCV